MADDNDQQDTNRQSSDGTVPASGEPAGPLLSFDNESTAVLPHWSEPATGELPVVEVAGAVDRDQGESSESRLFPQLPDDPKMVDGFAPVGERLPSSVDDLFGPRSVPNVPAATEPLLDPTGPMNLEELAAAGISQTAITEDPDTTIIRGLGDETPAQPSEPLGFESEVPDFQMPETPVADEAIVGHEIASSDADGDLFAGTPSADEPPATGILEVVTLDDPGSLPVTEVGMDDDFPQAPDVSALFDDDPPATAAPLGGDSESAGLRKVSIDPLGTGPITTSPVGAPSGAGAESEGLDAWANLDGPTPHWREGSQDYEERSPVQEDERTVRHFDDDDRRGGGSGGEQGELPVPSAGRNLPVAIAVGLTLAAVFFFSLRVGSAATMGLVVVALVLAASEFFQSVRNVGYRPAILLGLASVAGIALAAYWRGPDAYPVVMALLVVAGLVWFLLGVESEHATANLAITLLGVGWIGILGSFAALILRQPHGDAVLIGAVVGTVAYDVGGYLIGSTTGQSRLAPNISPNKTYEGLIGGMILAVVVTTVVLSQWPGIFPWENMSDALWMGVAVALTAPTGDLAQSMIKRDLGVKDMGTLLPGHGGVFDRFDALLFVLPAAYFVSDVLNIATPV